MNRHTVQLNTRLLLYLLLATLKRKRKRQEAGSTAYSVTKGICSAPPMAVIKIVSFVESKMVLLNAMKKNSRHMGRK